MVENKVSPTTMASNGSNIALADIVPTPVTPVTPVTKEVKKELAYLAKERRTSVQMQQEKMRDRAFSLKSKLAELLVSFRMFLDQPRF